MTEAEALAAQTPAALRREALTTTLVSGGTGSGKTSLLATLFEWVYQHSKRIGRLYTSDGGAGVSALAALAQLGIVQQFRLRSRVSIGEASRDLAFETANRASQGWWPAKFNPITGDTLPSIAMVAPITTTLRMFCPQKHLLKEAQVEAHLTQQACPECVKAAAQGTPLVMYSKRVKGVTIESSSRVTPGFELLGAVGFDGLTSICSWAMGDMADRMARGELGGEKSNLDGVVNSGDMSFGSNNRAHYQLVQTFAERVLVTSGAIPGLVIPAVWTSLETIGRAEDGDGREWGPQIAGSAKTGQVPSWVGNYLGCQQVEDQTKKRTEWRLYLRRFVGPDRIPHPYKHRADPQDMPEYLSDWNHDEIKDYLPDWEFSGQPGTPFSGFNLGIFFELLSRAAQRQAERARAKFPESPGLVLDADGMVVVGEPGKAYVADDMRPEALGKQDPQAPQAAAPTVAAKPNLGPPKAGAVLKPAGAPGAPTGAPSGVLPAPKPTHQGSPVAPPVKAPPSAQHPGPAAGPQAGRPPLPSPPAAAKPAPPPGVPPKKPS